MLSAVSGQIPHRNRLFCNVESFAGRDIALHLTSISMPVVVAAGDRRTAATTRPPATPGPARATAVANGRVHAFGIERLRAHAILRSMDVRRGHPSLLLGAAAALALIALVGRALAPLLLTKSPLLIVAMSPITSHLVLAATVTPMVPFIVVGVLRRMVAPALAYYIGRAYGPEGIAWIYRRYPRFGRFLRWIERWFDRAAPLLLLLVPEPGLCALAGATGLPVWIALLMVAIGQTIRVALIYRVGDALSEWLMPFMDFLREHMWTATLVCMLLAGGYAWLRHRRQRRMLEGGPEVDAGSGPPPAPASSER
jgi:membrane protein DedA with SNARE-associated domain